MLCVFYVSAVCADKLEVRYKLDGSRGAEVLRSSVSGLANGQLHTVTVRRLTDSVSVQVKPQQLKPLQNVHLPKPSPNLCTVVWAPAALKTNTHGRMKAFPS